MNSGEPMRSQITGMRQQVLNDKKTQKTHRQSDQPVVSMKQGNACGEKGLAGIQGAIRETPAIPRDGEWVRTKLKSLTQVSLRGGHKIRYTTLIYLLTEGFLKDCFTELKKDKASGVDGVSLEEYGANLDANITDLVKRMRAWQYRPGPSKRVYIPKSDGSKRPLGIPTIEDKVVQMAVKKILEAVYEPIFCDVSYGFRPNRNCHDALDNLAKTIMTRPVNYIVDVDIDKFFDTIDHKWLMRCLEVRIGDPNFLRLIGRFLKAGIMEDGKLIEVGEGAPQGAVLSPMLANIYLHYVLDIWFEKKIKPNLKGYAELIRYADDFVVMFQAHSEAESFMNTLNSRLAKFNLRIAPSKTRIIWFGRYAWQASKGSGNKVATFDFLGFTHYCDNNRNGKFKVGRKTSKHKFRQKMKAMNLWLKGVRNLLRLQEWWKMLAKKLIGHYNYYGISGNFAGTAMFYKNTIRLIYKWINRRSQKRSYNWEQFIRLLQYNPLPRPKVYHLTHILSSIRGCIPVEPNDRNGHVRFCEGH